MKKTIVIVACLDTKGREVGFAQEMIEHLGHRAFLVDVGVKEAPILQPDITREEVARAAGQSWEEVSHLGKHERLEAMIKGIPNVVLTLWERGDLNAVLSLGGAMNTTIGTTAMKALPLGVPKLMVSTVTSGLRTFEPYVGTKDIMLMHSVADLCGINLLTKSTLSNAVAALVGMVEHGIGRVELGKNSVVAATMLGVTNDGVTLAVRLVEEKGWQVLTFHANGVGGRAMEELISQGFIRGVMDLSLREIACEFYGGFCGGARDRLVAASKAGIPQIVAPGAADTIDYQTDALLPDWKRRKHVYMHPTILHLKLHQEEAIHVARAISSRLNEARGPVTMLIPLRGFHQFSFPGGPLWDPPVEKAFVETLRATLSPRIRWVEVDANINEPSFSRVAAEAMLELLRQE